MAEHEDPSVTVKLEIRVPVLAGAPVINVCQQPSPTGIHSPPLGNPPAPPNSSKAAMPAPVAPDPTLHTFGLSLPGPTPLTKCNGYTGVICAKGSDAIVAGNSAAFVWCLIMPGTVYPCPYASGIPKNVATSASVTGGAWVIPELGTVDCTYPPKAHTFFYWYEAYGGTFSGPFVANFTPVISDHTDCASGAAIVTAASRAPVAAFPITLPLAWKVTVVGFAGEGLEAFNANWRLDARQSGFGTVRYDNGGCGSKRPQIVLLLESPSADFWKLSFRAGARSVRYVLPLSEFRSMGPNAFGNVTIEGAGGRLEIPETLIITPA